MDDGYEICVKGLPSRNKVKNKVTIRDKSIYLITQYHTTEIKEDCGGIMVSQVPEPLKKRLEVRVSGEHVDIIGEDFPGIGLHIERFSKPGGEVYYKLIISRPPKGAKHDETCFCIDSKGNVKELKKTNA